jgi:hypothetical protein
VKDPDFTFDSNEKRENFDQDEHLEDKRPQTEDNDEDERVRTRKRTRNEDKWKRNIKNIR